MDSARDVQHEISCLLSQLGLGHIPWDWLIPGGAAGDRHVGVVCPRCVYGAVVLQ